MSKIIKIMDSCTESCGLRYASECSHIILHEETDECYITAQGCPVSCKVLGYMLKAECGNCNHRDNDGVCTYDGPSVGMKMGDEDSCINFEPQWPT